MCVAVAYLPVAGVSTPVVSVVLDSRCHVLGGEDLSSVGNVLLNSCTRGSPI